MGLVEQLASCVTVLLYCNAVAFFARTVSAPFFIRPTVPLPEILITPNVFARLEDSLGSVNTSLNVIEVAPVHPTPADVWDTTQSSAYTPGVDGTLDTRFVAEIDVFVADDCTSVPDAPLEIVLHPNPVPLVQVNALAAPLHDGTARPLGVVAVTAPNTVLADKEARFALGRFPVTPLPNGNPVILAALNAGALFHTRPVVALPLPVEVNTAALFAVFPANRVAVPPVPPAIKSYCVVIGLLKPDQSQLY